MNRDEREQGALGMLRAGFTVAETMHAFSLTRDTVENLLGYRDQPRRVLRAVEVPASPGWHWTTNPPTSINPDLAATRRKQLKAAIR